MADKTAALAPPVAKSSVKAPTLHRKCACGGTPGASGMCPECERKARGLMQRKAAGGATGPVAAPDVVSSALSGPGQPLDARTRSTMERGFGTDLSHVRVHTGAQAGESARAVDAHAYTVGSDIAFAPGQYDPHSAGGQRLLAHEIAHTVQQGGLQRSAASPLLEVSPAYSAAEVEADRAADAVMAGRNAPALRPTGPAVARKAAKKKSSATDPEPKPAKASAPPESAAPSSATALTEAPEGLNKEKLVGAGVVEVVETPAGDDLERVFVLDAFELPAEKGKLAEDVYKGLAEGGNLRTTMSVSRRGPADAQGRDDTSTLRSSWLEKVGWSEEGAADNWSKKTGEPKLKPFAPRFGGKACHMDHIQELQVRGTNVRENIQILDGGPNIKSGSKINQWLIAKSKAIQEAHTAKGKKPDLIAMRFQKVAVVGAEPGAKSCLQAEAKILKDQAAGVPEGGATVPEGTVATIFAYQGQKTRAYLGAKGVTRFDSGEAHHRSIRQLAVSFLLNSYHPEKDGGATVKAQLDAATLTGRSSNTKLLPTITKQPKPVFKATPNGKEGDVPVMDLAFGKMESPATELHYPLLSQIVFKKLGYSAEEGLAAEGTIKPSLPLFANSTLGVKLGGGTLAVGYEKGDALTLFPGARITAASLGLVLLPELSGKGEIALAFGSPSRPIATAVVTILADAGGFRASADLKANVPGLDAAAGKVFYRDGRWTGSFEVAFSNPRIPGFKGARLVVDFADGKIDPTGTIDLNFLNTDVELKAKLAGGGWYFSARVPRVKIPGLEGPISVFVEYAEGHLKATGKNAAFTFGTWRGTLAELTYEDGRLSGEGKVEVGKPEDRVSGTIDAKLFPNGKWTADGTISVRIREGLVATVGVHVDEAHKVTVKGELKFPDYAIPNTSFGNKLRKDLATISFPIAGLSVGSKTIGFSFDVTAFVEAHWSIGPARLTETYLRANFDPFEERTNYDLEGHTKLVMPMDVGFGGGLEGALSLDVLIASGKFGVEATLDIGAKADSGVEGTLRYQDGKFSLDSRAFIVARPYLKLDLDAFVRAKVVGFDPYEHKWPLKNWTLDSGFDVGISAPFKYDADRGLQIPGVDDVTVTYPDIDVRRLLNKFLAKVGI